MSKNIITKVAEQKEDKVAARYALFKLGQMVVLSGKYPARVVDIASNGVWILRTATNGEFCRTGRDQIRERVSIKLLSA